MKKFLYFTAPWCGPCQMFGPTMDRISQSGITVVKVNVDENKDLALQYNVRSVPTTILLKNELEINRFTGARSEQQIMQIYGN